MLVCRCRFNILNIASKNWKLEVFLSSDLILRLLRMRADFIWCLKTFETRRLCDVEAHVLYRTEPLYSPRLRVGPDAEGNLTRNSNRGLGNEP